MSNRRIALLALTVSVVTFFFTAGLTVLAMIPDWVELIAKVASAP